MSAKRKAHVERGWAVVITAGYDSFIAHMFGGSKAFIKDKKHAQNVAREVRSQGMKCRVVRVEIRELPRTKKRK